MVGLTLPSPAPTEPKRLEPFCRCPTLVLGETPRECTCGCASQPQAKTPCPTLPSATPEAPTSLQQKPSDLPSATPEAPTSLQHKPADLPSATAEAPTRFQRAKTVLYTNQPANPPSRSRVFERTRAALLRAKEKRLANLAQQAARKDKSTKPQPTQQDQELQQGASKAAGAVATETSEPTLPSVLPPGWSEQQHISPEQQSACKPKAKAKGKAKAKAKAVASSADLTEEPSNQAKRGKRKTKIQAEEGSTNMSQEAAKTRKRKSTKEDECQDNEGNSRAKQSKKQATAPVEEAHEQTVKAPRKSRKRAQPTQARKPLPKKTKKTAMRSRKRKAAKQSSNSAKAAKRSSNTAKAAKRSRNKKEHDKHEPKEEASTSKRAAPKHCNEPKPKTRQVSPEVKAQRSRKSAAYHRAKKEHINQGATEAQAIAAAKAATNLHDKTRHKCI